MKAAIGEAEKARLLVTQEGDRTRWRDSGVQKHEHGRGSWEFGERGREEGAWQEAGGKGLLLCSGVGTVGL